MLINISMHLKHNRDYVELHISTKFYAFQTSYLQVFWVNFYSHLNCNFSCFAIGIRKQFSHLILLLAAECEIRMVLELRGIRWRRRIRAEQSTGKIVIAERRRKKHVTANKRNRKSLIHKTCDSLKDQLGWSRRLVASFSFVAARNGIIVQLLYWQPAGDIDTLAALKGTFEHMFFNGIVALCSNLRWTIFREDFMSWICRSDGFGIFYFWFSFIIFIVSVYKLHERCIWSYELQFSANSLKNLV